MFFLSSLSSSCIKPCLSQIDLITTLAPNELYKTGEECLARLKGMNFIRFDARFFASLWQNQELIPEGWKDRSFDNNIRYFHFDGTVLLNPGEFRGIVNLHWLKDRWYYRSNWLGSVRYHYDLSVVLKTAT